MRARKVNKNKIALKLWRNPVAFLVAKWGILSEPRENPDSNENDMGEVSNLINGIRPEEIAKGLAMVGLIPLVLVMYGVDQLSSAAFIVLGGTALLWLGTLLAAAAVCGLFWRMLRAMHRLDGGEEVLTLTGTVLSVGLVGYLDVQLFNSAMLGGYGTLSKVMIVVMATALLFGALSVLFDISGAALPNSKMWQAIKRKASEFKCHFVALTNITDNRAKLHAKKFINATSWRGRARLLLVGGALAGMVAYAVGVAQTGHLGLQSMMQHSIGFGIAFVAITSVLAGALLMRSYAQWQIKGIARNQKDGVKNGFHAYAKYQLLFGLGLTGLMMYPGVQCMLAYAHHTALVPATVFPQWLALSFVGVGALFFLCVYVADQKMDVVIDQFSPLATAVLERSGNTENMPQAHAVGSTRVAGSVAAASHD